MPRYEFTATTARGDVVRGAVEAPDDGQAIRRARSRQVFITQMFEVGTSGGRAVVPEPPPRRPRMPHVRFWVYAVGFALALCLLYLAGAAAAGELIGWHPVPTFLGGAAVVYATVWALARWSNRVLRRQGEWTGTH